MYHKWYSERFVMYFDHNEIKKKRENKYIPKNKDIIVNFWGYF